MLAALLLAAAGPSTTPPPPADPVTAVVHAEDADRFAALFARSGGTPTAEQLQHEYLDRGTYGVHVFTEWRIRDAAHLARTVAAKRERYAAAIRDCLPVARATTGELRATYLALRGLYPDRALPQIYLVFGAGNSGGTAGPGAQVLGLEKMCEMAPTPDALRALMRFFFAHETVHALQRDPAPEVGPLLASVMREGAADFVAALATGRPSDPERAAWAGSREAELWRRLGADLEATRGLSPDRVEPGTPAADAMRRWVNNHGSAPSGWPGELGYWMGQRVWERWFDRQPDKRAALDRMLALDRLDEVLAAGAPAAAPNVTGVSARTPP